jgi:hypothetical protein
LKEERRTPDATAGPPRELDAEVEELTRRTAEVINSAGVEQRQDLREYALGLLKEETEVGDALPARSGKTDARGTNPLAMALLLGLVSLPLLLLFLPVGLTLFAVAFVLGIWGIVSTLVRR